jgi:hypothetical protein
VRGVVGCIFDVDYLLRKRGKQMTALARAALERLKAELSQFKLIKLLDAFLKSDKAEELTVKEHKDLPIATEEAKKEGPQNGWAKLRNFLSGGVAFTSIAKSAIDYRGPIAQGIKSLLGLP